MYFLVGLCGLTIDLTVFALLRLTPVYPVAANGLSIAVAALGTFVLHARFTFRVNVSVTAIGLFAGVVFLGLVLATAIFSMLMVLGVAVLDAKFVATASAIGLQFVLNRSVVFRSSRKNKFR